MPTYTGEGTITLGLPRGLPRPSVSIVDGQYRWFWPAGVGYLVVDPTLWDQPAFRALCPWQLDLLGEGGHGMLLVWRRPPAEDEVIISGAAPTPCEQVE